MSATAIRKSVGQVLVPRLSHHTFATDSWPLITGSRALVGDPVERRQGTRRPRFGLTCQWNSCTAALSTPEELEMIRREIEAFDHIGAVDDEIRGIVARNWPHVLSKLPPEEDSRGFRFGLVLQGATLKGRPVIPASASSKLGMPSPGEHQN